MLCVNFVNVITSFWSFKCSQTIFFLESVINAGVSKKILEQFELPSADQLHWLWSGNSTTDIKSSKIMALLLLEW